MLNCLLLNSTHVQSGCSGLEPVFDELSRISGRRRLLCWRYDQSAQAATAIIGINIKVARAASGWEPPAPPPSFSGSLLFGGVVGATGTGGMTLAVGAADAIRNDGEEEGSTVTD